MNNPLRFKISVNFLLLSFICVLPSCQQDSVQVYRVPKEKPFVSVSEKMKMETSANSSPRWKAPPTWMVQPVSDMRLASFLIKGKNNQSAEVSVVSLPGDAGGDLANINRWRQQINLGPLDEITIHQQVKSISPGGNKMKIVNFVSDQLLIDNKYKKRVIAATHFRSGKSWFFKMTGEDETVQSAEKDFLKFLESVKFPSHE